MEGDVKCCANLYLYRGLAALLSIGDALELVIGVLRGSRKGDRQFGGA